MNSIIRGLENIGCEFIQRFPMRRFTSLRVGGIADLIVYPKTCSELINLINMLSSFKVKWVVLGAGSNTIVYDEGFRGVIIVTRKLKSIEKRGYIKLERGKIVILKELNELLKV